MSKREIFKRAWNIRRIKAYEMGCKVSEVSMSECLKMVYAGVKLANVILSVRVCKSKVYPEFNNYVADARVIVEYGQYAVAPDGQICSIRKTRRFMPSATNKVLNFMHDKTVGCKTLRMVIIFTVVLFITTA